MSLHTTTSPQAHDAAAPLAERREWLRQPPPRPEDAVSAFTARMRRRARTAWWVTGGLFGVGFLSLALSGPLQSSEAAPALTAVGALGVIGSLISAATARYFRSRGAAMARLVRDGAITTAEVAGFLRSRRGELLVGVFAGEDGSRARLLAEGHLFSRCCAVGDTLPCLTAPGRHAAVLLPNGELALGACRPLHPE